MELKYLQTFITIVNCGSFNRAAKQLNYAQSTVTFHIQQLERELGVQLFTKIGRRMVLTNQGKALQPQVLNILNDINQLATSAGSQNSLAGRLDIAVAESILTYLLTPILSTYRKLAPNVELNIHTLNCYDIYNQIGNGHYDLGIHYNIGADNQSVTMHNLRAVPIALVGSPLLDSGRQNFNCQNEFKDLCLITNDRHSIYQRMFNSYLTTNRIVLKSSMELEGIEAMKQCLISNLGVAILPRFVAQKELGHQLVTLPCDLNRQTINICYSYHQNKGITAPMKLMIRLLTQELQGKTKVN